jgi:hypothetical protein
LQSQPVTRLRTHWGILVSLVVLLSMLATLDTSTGAGAAGKTPVVRAAFYFGSGSPINFWNSDLSGAATAFNQIKQDGFTAVELAVPWGEFQEGVTPARYNAAAFTRLKMLVSLAASLHLQVILRLSYDLDVDPRDQSPARYVSVFSNQAVYTSWLAYISRIHQSVASFSNVKIGELSWEDFWTPVQEAQSATTPAQQLQLATSTGYRSWLQRTYSLAKVSEMYGATFTNWSTVPTPASTQPAFKLMFQYDDWALVHRFFVPAAARFPGLNLEARVDIDPIHQGTQVVGSYSHASTFQLPGTSYIGMYFSPYMGDPSSNPLETASQGLTALQSTLASMRTRSGNRPLFIFEYEIVSNSPQVASDPGLPPNQVPQFILGSAPILQKYTVGYALWTYHDYNLSPLYNPSFSLGTSGWTVHGSASAARSAPGSSLTLLAGASVSQPLAYGYLGTGPVMVSVTASVPANSSATLNVGLGGAPVQAIAVQGGSQTYHVQVPMADVAVGATGNQLSLTASSSVSISNVQVYNFTQVGDIYGVDGTAGVGAVPLRTLNQQLASGGSTAAS